MEAHSPVPKARSRPTSKKLQEKISDTWKDVFSPKSMNSIKRETTVSQLVSDWEHVHKQTDPSRDETYYVWKHCKNLDSPYNDGSVKTIGDLTADPPTLYLDEITHFKIPRNHEDFNELNSYLNALFSARATKFDYLRVGIYSSKTSQSPIRVTALVSPARERNTFWLSIHVKAEDVGYDHHHHVPAEKMIGLRKIALFSHTKTPNDDKKFMDREWNIIQYDLLETISASRDSRAASLSNQLIPEADVSEMSAPHGDQLLLTGGIAGLKLRKQQQEEKKLIVSAETPIPRADPLSKSVAVDEEVHAIVLGDEDHQTPLAPELRHTLPIAVSNKKVVESLPLQPPQQQLHAIVLGEEDHQTPLAPELRHTLPIAISKKKVVGSLPLQPPQQQLHAAMLGEEDHQTPLPPELRHTLPIVISDSTARKSFLVVDGGILASAAVAAAAVAGGNRNSMQSQISASEGSSSYRLSRASDFFKSELKELEVKATTDQLHSELLDELKMKKIDRIWCSEKYFLSVSTDIDGLGSNSCTILSADGKVTTTEGLCCLLDDHLFEWLPGICLKE
jgi:hypothetical protein